MFLVNQKMTYTHTHICTQTHLSKYLLTRRKYLIKSEIENSDFLIGAAFESP